jgi:hypothetical protein
MLLIKSDVFLTGMFVFLKTNKKKFLPYAALLVAKINIVKYKVLAR